MVPGEGEQSSVPTVQSMRDIKPSELGDMDLDLRGAGTSREVSFLGSKLNTGAGSNSCYIPDPFGLS